MVSSTYTVHIIQIFKKDYFFGLKKTVGLSKTADEDLSIKF